MIKTNLATMLLVAALFCVFALSGCNRTKNPPQAQASASPTPDIQVQRLQMVVQELEHPRVRVEQGRAGIDPNALPANPFIPKIKSTSVALTDISRSHTQEQKQAFYHVWSDGASGLQMPEGEFWEPVARDQPTSGVIMLVKSNSTLSESSVMVSWPPDQIDIGDMTRFYRANNELWAGVGFDQVTTTRKELASYIWESCINLEFSDAFNHHINYAYALFAQKPSSEGSGYMVYCHQSAVYRGKR